MAGKRLRRGPSMKEESVKSGESFSQVPSSLDLALMADEVMGGLAGLSAHPAGIPTERPGGLELEYRVSLRGYRQAELVARCSWALAGAVAEACLSDRDQRRDAGELFAKFLRVYSLKLADRIYRDHEALVIREPQPCSAEQWPTEEPSSSCVVLVKNEPLELRLWMGRRIELLEKGRAEEERSETGTAAAKGMLTNAAMIGLADEILGAWALLSAVPAKALDETRFSYDLEYRVSLPGPLKIDLVIRGPLALGELFANTAARSSAFGIRASEAFSDFSYLYAMGVNQLLHQDWPRPVFSRLPQPSRPWQWPRRTPQASCSAMVRGLPLEILLWMDEGP
jgi:hypothetical protein